MIEMKKIIVLIFAAFLMLQTVFAGEFYADEYPTIPEYIKNHAEEILGVDNTGASFLYEKIAVNDNVVTWMVGWFWDDYKIVAGITNNRDIIYYNKAVLGETFAESDVSGISTQQAYETALEFITKINPGKDIRFVNSKAYTYKFAEYKNGIRIFGHDASVVVDKSSGDVYYYNGFGKYECDFETVKTLISKEHAFDVYFDKIGMEAVYLVRRDNSDRWQSVRPVYILNRPENLAIDAQKPVMREFLMHDYNYYYSDDYVNSFYASDNCIDFDTGIFVKSEDIAEDKAVSEKLRNLFYSLRNGYVLDYSSGTYVFYDDINGKNEIPCIAVDIYPQKNLVYGEKLKTLYETGDFLSLADYSTSLEYIYAKAYVSSNGRLLGFDSVISDNYNPLYSKEDKNLSGIPQRVEEFVDRAFGKNEDLRLWDSYKENEYRISYTFARYKNGLRVIGEGVTVTYNAARGDISKCKVNLSTRQFPTVDGIKTSKEMKQFVKNEVDLNIAYVDFGDAKKIPVYQFDEKQACFDPFTGNRTDLLDLGNVKKTFICNVGNPVYNINGHNVPASAPIYKNGSFYLPAELFAGELGFKTYRSEKTLKFVSGSDTIVVDTVSGISTVNGKIVTVETRFEYNDDELYVPLTFMTRIFGLQSWWDEDDGKIIIDAG